MLPLLDDLELLVEVRLDFSSLMTLEERVVFVEVVFVNLSAELTEVFTSESLKFDCPQPCQKANDNNRTIAIAVRFNIRS
tara:strand:+ start:130 stop:369 length:240 start_codon:yes stop_codon:yes gene_type:complete